MTTGRINQVTPLARRSETNRIGSRSVASPPRRGGADPAATAGCTFRTSRDTESSLPVAVLHSRRPPGVGAGGFAFVGIERELRRTHGQETLRSNTIPSCEATAPRPSLWQTGRESTCRRGMQKGGRSVAPRERSAETTVSIRLVFSDTDCPHIYGESLPRGPSFGTRPAPARGRPSPSRTPRRLRNGKSREPRRFRGRPLFRDGLRNSRGLENTVSTADFVRNGVPELCDFAARRFRCSADLEISAVASFRCSEDLEISAVAE